MVVIAISLVGIGALGAGIGDGILEVKAEEWFPEQAGKPLLGIEPLPPLDDWAVLGVSTIPLALGHLAKNDAAKSLGVGMTVYSGAMLLKNVIVRTSRQLGVFRALDMTPLLYESYSQGPQMAVQAIAPTLIPTILLTVLNREIDGLESVEGMELPVGTEIRVAGTLYDESYNPLNNKPVHIYHKLGGASFSRISIASTSNGNFVYTYTLDEVGTHTFYCEFLGDSQYEGCAKKVFARAR